MSTPDTPDVFDWYYDDGYGPVADASEYERQGAPHTGLSITMISNPVSGDYVVPAVGCALLINNIHLSPVTVSLPLADVDGEEPDLSRTITVPPGGWGILPVPPKVFGYEPLPIVYDGIPDVAYVSFY